MASKAYTVGRIFEKKVQRFFEENGYYCVRSAGSKSPSDLLCVKKDKPPIAIQCRHTAVPYFTGGKLSKSEEEILVGMQRYGIVPMLASHVKGGAIRLTNLLTRESNEVRLKPITKKKGGKSALSSLPETVEGLR